MNFFEETITLTKKAMEEKNARLKKTYDEFLEVAEKELRYFILDSAQSGLTHFTMFLRKFNYCEEAVEYVGEKLCKMLKDEGFDADFVYDKYSAYIHVDWSNCC